MSFFWVRMVNNLYLRHDDHSLFVSILSDFLACLADAAWQALDGGRGRGIRADYRPRPPSYAAAWARAPDFPLPLLAPATQASDFRVARRSPWREATLRTSFLSSVEGQHVEFLTTVQFQ